MVRTNSLSFRLLCLEYGADLVYTEELIDYRLSRCRRLENKVLETVDYVDDQGEVILRTSPIERDRLILQIGSNDPERAIKAAQLVAPDISGVDFNFGCPKSFSLSGGMGAALLERPDQIKELLTRSVESLELPVTCKIRILPDLDKTIELVKMIEQCGVSAIAVHGRTKEQRSRDENQDDVIRAISEAVEVPVIANGGSNVISSYANILKFKERTRASSVMIGRSAMRNPSIFKSDNDLVEIDAVIRRFLQLSVKFDTYISNVKYAMQTMTASGHYSSEILHRFHAANDYAALCDTFQLGEWYKENGIRVPKSEYYEPESLENKWLAEYVQEKREALKSHEFVIDCVPYNQRIYGPYAPKSQLNDLIVKNHWQHPQSEVFRLEGAKKGRFLCSMIFRDVFYLNKSHSISKKAAEHATSMLICERFSLTRLDEYKTRVNASSKNVT